jgi:intracellular sulfur oxidation DsrE/DsrF family protein
MSEEHKVSDELRNAFVDGELDAAEWARVAQSMERDPELREEVGELRLAKDLVRHAYAVPPSRRRHVREAAAFGWRSVGAAALVFTAAGWFGHAWWQGEPALDPASAYALRGDWHTLRSDWRSLDGNRVLVHVSSGGREALGTALDEVEDLLRSARSERRSVEVEIVANSTGLDLLRADASPYAARIAALRREFPELGLVACGQTLERRRALGRQVTLLPGTAVAPSALDQVVKRLRGGWIYVRA